MSKQYTNPLNFHLGSMIKSKMIKCSFILLLLLAIFSVKEVSASHYRYGNISWTRTDDVTRTVTFTINQAWRRSFFGASNVGNVVNTGSFAFGDGSSTNINLVVTSVNITEDWLFGTFTVSHTYAGAATSFTPNYTNCCRISASSNSQNNVDGNFSSQTVVKLLSGSLSAPVITMPPIVNLPINNSAATFNVSAYDPDGTALTYALSTAAEAAGGGTYSQPSGLSINSSTGAVTFNTVGKTVGQLFNSAYTITDASGAKTMVDVIIKMVASTNPPQFNYAITPSNGFVYTVNPGQTVTFNINAFDTDLGDNVTLSAVGLASGMTFSPTLPRSGNPVASSFSWTPTTGQLGTKIINFTAQDINGSQVNTTVVINVNMNPIFVNPTHALNSDRHAETGIAIIDTVMATNPDNTVNTQLFSATIPSNATMTPTIPTAFSLFPTSIMNWTPLPSNFGVNTFTYVAKDVNNKTTTHTYDIVANTTPVFTSTPVINAVVGQLYTYNIVVNDPDLPYGDTLHIEDYFTTSIPSWLTLTDNEDGTATLSGTPTLADIGMHDVDLITEDIYHHNHADVIQSFQIQVANLVLPKPTLLAFPNNSFCLGQNVILKATGMAGATFNWTLPAGTSGVVDNSVSGMSTITINNISATDNGYYTVSQSLAGYPTSAIDSILINVAPKPVLNFVTTSCVSGAGQITVDANPSVGMEYAVNGGVYQNSNILNATAGSTFVVAVKAQNTSCATYYTGNCVNCNLQTGCTTPAKDSILAPKFACAGTPISIDNYLINATTATFTASGTGTLSTNNTSSTPITFTYNPSLQDVVNGFVIITATSNDPDGVGPCQSSVSSKLIQLANGLVAPALTTSSPICENSQMNFEALHVFGNVSWLGANGYTSSNAKDSILSTPANMQGTLFATISGAGCTPVSASTSVAVIAAPNLNVVVTPHDEICAGNANGSIEVSVAGGSGNYTICYNSNLSNCVIGTNANFQYIAPGNYTVTIVDQACPTNTFSYPVTINAGAVVSVPSVPSNISICEGENLVLSGTTGPANSTINWTFSNGTFNALGLTATRFNATTLMSGTYIAKTINASGCASLGVNVNVTINETPFISHVQVNCNATNSKVVVTASLSSGTMSYSLDGITYQASNEFDNYVTGNYTLYVKNNATNCIATDAVYIPNCNCPNEPVVNIVHPITSCGLTAIPLTATFTNVTNSTWSSAGTGTFSTTTGTTGFTTNYTPSAAELTTGEAQLTLTTADPDASGPCTMVSKIVKVKLVNTLPQPAITVNQTTFCTGDSVVLMSNVNTAVNWTGVAGFTSTKPNAVVSNATQFLSGYYKVTTSGNGCVTKMDSLYVTIAAPPTINVTTSVVPENCEFHANGEITVSATGGTGNYIICNDLWLNCNNTTSSYTFKSLAPATYQIHVADATCPNYNVIVPVTVNPGLHVDGPTSASYNNPVCKGEDLVLTATGLAGSTFLWTDTKNNFTVNGAVVTRTNAQPQMSAAYKVERLEGGCASLPLVLNVHVFDNPTITSVDTMCVGSIDSGRITINSTIAIGDQVEYALNNGAFQTSNVFDGLSNGLYQINARAIGSDCVTTLNDVELYCNCNCNRDAIINTFPNPSSGSFSINAILIKESEEITISVFDLSGKTIYQKQLSSKAGQLNHAIDIKNYATGTYLLKVNIDGETFIKSIQLNK